MARKIEHYRISSRQIMDRKNKGRTQELIAEMQAEKAALHPERA